MNSNASELWTTLNFVFADDSNMAFDVQLSESVITEITIDPGPPDFRTKCTIDELFGINTSLFAEDTFPYHNLWFKYAQLSAAEKYFKVSVPARTELIRVIIFEYLRIAEYLFCLATFSLNIGLNEFFTNLMEKHESLHRFLRLILAEIAPFEYISGIKKVNDLPAGFTERNLKFLTQIQPCLEHLFMKLLGNRIVIGRCQDITLRPVNQSIPLSSGPNLRATGSSSDRRHDFPYSYYQKIFFDRVERQRNPNQTCEYWHRLRIRCEEILISVHLIRQAVKLLVYEKNLSQSTQLPASLLKGHASSVTETPWGVLTCQMNCPGGKDLYEFILTNPMHEILLLLRQTAVGLELSDFPLLVASLGLRPKMELI